MPNSFGIISETYPSDITLTGGNVSISVSGVYESHQPANTENGFFRSVNANCAPSDDLCYSAYYHASTVVVKYYDGLVIPPGPIYCKTVTLDSTGFHLTVSPFPFGQ